ncbi:MAG: 4Fe-4S dicluster domain-containing protein [Chloroflexi bacterium]|nr:4Fe-4S dicluster domain-containing protein [Chloroflexota bacterium]
MPLYCKLCLQACPQACFRVETVKFERLRESNREEPGAYVLDAPFRYNCTLCNVCVDVCPVHAITVTPQEV